MYPETYWQFHTLVLTLAWFAGFGYGIRRGWAWPRSLGLALVAYPFARLAVGVWLTFGSVFEGGVAPTLSVAELWSKVVWHTIWFLLVPGVGLALVYERFPGLARGPAREGAFVDNGLAPRTGWGADSLAGASLFFPLALAYFVAAWILVSAVGRFVNTGDDSAVFDNVTPLIVLLLSVVAGVTEEFLFRGLLQNALQRRMPFLAANLVQGVAFGLVHSGYGNLAHVLGPLAFGLAMGLVQRRLGIMAAVVLHAQVDVLALGLSNVTVATAFLFGGLVTWSLYGMLVLRLGPVRTLLGGDGAARAKAAPAPPGT